MKLKRRTAAWILLAVFLPMLVLSSVHIHEGSSYQKEIRCDDCLHHTCHGHIAETISWAHDCVLCQFLTLPMLAAATIAVTIYVHVCRKYPAQRLCGYHAASCGSIVTRGPPSL